jgi:voltage-gated potassium channel
MFSFYGAIDLLSILPFVLSFGMGTEALRALRLMRLFWLFKLARNIAAMLRFYRALVIAREEMALFGSMALILLYLSGVGMYHFEHKAQPEAFASVFDGLWWALCTLTTVGFGDVYPVTMGGKALHLLHPGGGSWAGGGAGGSGRFGTVASSGRDSSGAANCGAGRGCGVTAT